MQKTERDRENAGTSMSNQQMRYEQTLYPVDRYLVESSKKIGMINIIDDDIWNPEPALRPEDEIILRKLHDMLQSTADDLKLLSGELSKYHEPGVQKKILPTPLDEEFNEKVHIEEVVNAKFHGHKIIDHFQLTSPIAQKDIVHSVVQSIDSKRNTKNDLKTSKQVPSDKKTIMKKKLGISRTNILQIQEHQLTDENQSISNNTKRDISTQKNKLSCVAYNEFSYKYVKPKVNNITTKPLQIQEMPSISIRSQLTEQKVLQLDIIPDSAIIEENESIRNNALVIELKHETVPKLRTSKPITFDHIQLIPNTTKKPITRKISTLPIYESSESTNNVSSEYQQNAKGQKIKIPATFMSSRSVHDSRRKTKKNLCSKKDSRRSKPNLQEWKNKLNTIYGATSKNSGVKLRKQSPKKVIIKSTVSHKKSINDLHDVEYIPYSKLTLGGVNVRDIEREISSIPNRNDIVLSPILDKILSSRENSFHQDSSTKNKKRSPKILTTSDENLLQEVMDIEKQVTQTISVKNGNKTKTLNKDQSESTKTSDSYKDDFEEENSYESENQESKSESIKRVSPNNSYADKNPHEKKISKDKLNQRNGNSNFYNKTFTKVSNLAFKNEVDIFEFIHSVDTQDIGTQITNKIRPNETLTSPQNDNSNIKSIHNDLRPSIDPQGEVEEMFKLEKDLIKKLIIEEYGDLFEKKLNNPTTSRNSEMYDERNLNASQKNTQTSPTHVKSVMTSPTRTKTRTTSPFALTLSVNQQTSPIVVISNDEELKVEKEKNNDLGISVNLSSPRFSLRLPQTSRDILPNVATKSVRQNTDINCQKYISSSSSVDDDYSSSDISSIGEIHKKYKRRLRKVEIPSLSELSSSSSLSRHSTDPSGFILPLRSEGEISLEQVNKRKSNKVSKSEGELSLGQLN